MAMKDSFVSALEVVPLSFTSGASVSEPVHLGGLRLFAIGFPSPWTGASVTFQISLDGGASWSNLRDKNGDEVAVTPVAGDCTLLDPAQFAAIQHIRLRAGTAAAPVVQDAARALQLVLRAV